ncbi:MAG: response regulator transcription factor [Campylobacterota bacterium]|nr:response regulator transcription factor [Campylobacterota bacterium]
MRTLLFSTDTSLLDRWKMSLNNFDLVQINDIETLYSEVLKEQAAVLINLASCGSDPIKFLKPLVESGAHVMVLDPSPTYANTKKILEVGVRGYGSLMMHDIHLSEALKAILDGNIWLYPDFIDEMVERLSEKRSDNDNEKVLEKLSQREKEVALYVKDGLTNKDIAQKLDITIRTVKAHTHNIYDKTGVSNRLALALLFNK